jgi:CCR4-NOT transcription complex subunit 7/8
VDLLRIIQLGLTLADPSGDLPDGVCTWQFNFRFSIKYVPIILSHVLTRLLTRRNKKSDDMYAPESIELLTKSGLNFKKHEEHGIDVNHFGELLISSGLVLLEDVKWISFHRYASAELDMRSD